MRILQDVFRYNNLRYDEIEANGYSTDVIDGFVEKLKDSKFEEKLLNSNIIINFRDAFGHDDWIIQGDVNDSFSEDEARELMSFLKYKTN